MPYKDQIIIYILLVIPTLFAVTVLGQGIYKMKRQERDGRVITFFGVLFLLLILLAYVFFIR